MRLLGYALVFFLTFQLARDRGRARAMLGWLVAAGLVYAVIGLVVFWSDYSPAWLFGAKDMPPDLRSTFVNRNHFATWQGLTMLCAIVWLHLRMARPGTRPYTLPDDRATSAERWVLQAWLPLTAILLMATALILTHSRGGFLATLMAVIVLLVLLESRMPVKRVRARVGVLAALAVSGLAFYMSGRTSRPRGGLSCTRMCATESPRTRGLGLAMGPLPTVSGFTTVSRPRFISIAPTTPGWKTCSSWAYQRHWRYLRPSAGWR
jgi:hypothetical protein